jgi:hypothetical protein
MVEAFFYKISAFYEPLKVGHQVLFLAVQLKSVEPDHHPLPVGGDNLVEIGDFGAIFFNKLGNGDGFKGVVLQVDHIDLFGRVVFDFLRNNIDPQIRLPGGNHKGEIIVQAVHRPGPQTHDQAHQPVLSPDPGRPAEFIVAYRHPA